MSEISKSELHLEERLADAGLRDVSRARNTIEGLSGQGVTDDDVASLIPLLLKALRASPDPDRALVNFARWTVSVTSRYSHFQLLLRHPIALDIFFNVCGTSQVFSEILIENPEYFEILANPGVRGGARSASAIYQELSALIDAISNPDLKLEAMRRFKKREYLRIGARDILGLADLSTTVREFSNLADACIQKCLEIAVGEVRAKYGANSEVPFAVIAMGKLGGRELNYSSDIDLMFVLDDRHAAGDAIPFATKVAEFIVSALSKDLQNGHLFRVDMRLRPEGRFGALVRSLSSYQTYYESWGEPWEMQALIKARFVAGNTRLGNEFMKMVSPYVYRRSVTSEFVAEIQRNKRKIELKAEREVGRNVKIGAGGIRDIEFTVQLLQLELGGRNPSVRSPNTVDAIFRLKQAGAFSDDVVHDFGADYEFLRNVEHRIQILYGLQTQTIPVDDQERTFLARRLGFSDLESFDEEYRWRTARVRGVSEKHFYSNKTPSARQNEDDRTALIEKIEFEDFNTISDKLKIAGFMEPDSTASNIRTTIEGTAYGETDPESRNLFKQFAPDLIRAASRTGDPDGVVAAVESLAAASPNRGALYRALRDSKELLDRLAILSAGSPSSILTLSRHFELLDLLVSEDVIDPGIKDAASYHSELVSRLRSLRNSQDEERKWKAVAGYMLRERLRIAARDLWGVLPPLEIAVELTGLADSVIEWLLEKAIRQVNLQKKSSTPHALNSIAVIGLGKLGGCEIGYGSDWDILVVFEDNSEGLFEAVNAVTEELLSAGEWLRAYDLPVTLDARLRPEGRFGALARTVDDYLRYYREESQVWELQVLTKARHVAGCSKTSDRYLAMVNDLIYERGAAEDFTNEVRAMKRKIESDRLNPEQKLTDLKLGHGGLSDIEFTAQLWQLKVGKQSPEVQATPTVEVLHSLAANGAIPNPEALRLAEAYAFLIGVRNRLTLLGGLSTDVLPEDLRRLRALAIGLGVADTRKSRAEDAFRAEMMDKMKETREIIDRLFYH